MAWSGITWLVSVAAVMVSGAVAAGEGHFRKRPGLDLGFANHGGMWGDLLLLPVVNAVAVPWIEPGWWLLAPIAFAAIASLVLHVWWHGGTPHGVRDHLWPTRPSGRWAGGSVAGGVVPCRLRDRRTGVAAGVGAVAGAARGGVAGDDHPEPARAARRAAAGVVRHGPAAAMGVRLVCWHGRRRGWWPPRSCEIQLAARLALDTPQWKSCDSTADPSEKPSSRDMRSARIEVTPSWFCNTPSTSRNGDSITTRRAVA